MTDITRSLPAAQWLSRLPTIRPTMIHPRSLAGHCLAMLVVLGAPAAQAAIQSYTTDAATGNVTGSTDKVVGTLSIDTTSGLILSESLRWLNHFDGVSYFTQDGSSFAGNYSPNTVAGTTELFVQSTFSSRTGFDIRLNTGGSLVGWNGGSLTLNQGFMLTNCCRGRGESYYAIADLTFVNDHPLAAVPEPASSALLLAGGGGLALLSRRRRPR